MRFDTMQKIRFLKNFGYWSKDTYRVILGEDEEYYHVHVDLKSLETVKFHKSENGKLFVVVERS